MTAFPQVFPNNFGDRYAAGGANRRARRALPPRLPCWSGNCGALPASRLPSAGGGAMATWSMTGSIASTTSGSVSWHARLLGLFHSPYQPTEPALFHEMMASLPIEFDQFTFIYLGSGKGRTLLMASEYPFRKIVGVELIAELHRAAEENIGAYKSPTQRCTQVESLLADARDFELPEEPLLLYLFNPLPER